MASMPNDLAAKTLQDILGEWALYADRVKGARMYQLELVSPNVLQKETIDAEDYLVAADILRVMTQRISADLTSLAELPGAKVAKIGDVGTSISDLKYRLEDLERFKLQPLLGMVQQTAISKFPEFTKGYLQNNIFDLNLKTEQAAANVTVYENSMNLYITKTRGAGFSAPRTNIQPGQTSQPEFFSNSVPAMIPQFGESFMESLVQMGMENSDAVFRQNMTERIVDTGLEKVRLEFQVKYYAEMLEKISLGQGQNVELSEEERSIQKAVAKKIDQNQQEVFDGLMATIHDMNLIYESLSKSNLNPESTLYSTTSPTLFSVQKPISVKRLVMMAVLGMFLCEGVILMAVLVRGSKKAA